MIDDAITEGTLIAQGCSRQGSRAIGALVQLRRLQPGASAAGISA